MNLVVQGVLEVVEHTLNGAVVVVGVLNRGVIKCTSPLGSV